MKTILQVLILATAFGAAATNAQPIEQRAGAQGDNAAADTSIAFNFPKITFRAGSRATHTGQQADPAGPRGMQRDADTTLALNFVKITFSFNG